VKRFGSLQFLSFRNRSILIFKQAFHFIMLEKYNLPAFFPSSLTILEIVSYPEITNMKKYLTFISSTLTEKG
jgi:hypothetical protein